ncbi:unnamed protein product [Calicophoron daubneyi]|uniref:Lupus La protein n=1 Tax=Calicophoron daubneyi TaxID=300641 RepID=A0AAV2T5Z3_CALDB
MEISPLEAKIIKQVEYYFGDINLSRDKFMKQVIAENDGWISLDTMLKFNRLKALSDDPEVIKGALSKSTSGLLELGPNGVRRNPECNVPDTFDEAFAAYKDRSVYVKGFDPEATLDEIIEWLERVGGKTLNVHMRRLPKDKKFKGSIFAVFEKKEDAEKFLTSAEAAEYKDHNMIRMYREDYWKGKKESKTARSEAKAEKQAAAEANRDAEVTARMSTGALLELSGLPMINKEEVNTTGTKNGDSGNSDKPVEPISEGESSEKKTDENGTNAPAKEDDDEEPAEAPTILALKEFLVEKIGTSYPIAWVDMKPPEGKAVVRFKMANTAELAWTKLKSAFDGKPVVYANCELSGRVLTGDEEKNHWKGIFAAQQQKAQKRRGRQHGRNLGNKRRRMN